MSAEAGLPSIRQRLSRTVLLLAFVWAVLAGVTVWWAVQREVEELMDDTLQASADVLAELMAADTGRIGGAGQPVAGPVADKHFAWQLVGPGRQLLLRSTLAPPQAWAPQLDADNLADVDGLWRVFGRPLAGGRMLYVAQTSAERGEVRLAVGVASAGTAALVGVLCALWLRARVRRELAPLADFSEAIQHHDPLAAGARLARPEREELLPIRDAIEALGTRLARRVANERAFSAHAAHALRTPLAGMDAQLAVALRESPPELQPRLRRTREAAARLGRVVGALLTLFRSGIDQLHRQPVDVAALLHRLPLEGLQLEVEPGPPLDADPDLLAAALINLLDNALRYGAHRLVVRLEPGAIHLHDDGQGVPPARLAELQAALDAQDYEGRMGLGLMMADMVARAHGGRLELVAAATGFAAVLHLGHAGRARGRLQGHGPAPASGGPLDGAGRLPCQRHRDGRPGHARELSWPGGRRTARGGPPAPAGHAARADARLRLPGQPRVRARLRLQHQQLMPRPAQPQPLNSSDDSSPAF